MKKGRSNNQGTSKAESHTTLVKSFTAVPFELGIALQFWGEISCLPPSSLFQLCFQLIPFMLTLASFIVSDTACCQFVGLSFRTLPSNHPSSGSISTFSFYSDSCIPHCAQNPYPVLLSLAPPPLPLRNTQSTRLTIFSARSRRTLFFFDVYMRNMLNPMHVMLQKIRWQ